MQKCCDNPRLRLYQINLKGNKDTQKDICDNCGTETELYEPEMGQAVFGNPMGEFDFDSMENSGIVEDMLRIISWYATGDSSYSDEFKNDVFELRSYYWGEDDEIEALPNFKHYKTGLEIRWYKYIGRGMSVNKHVCPECFYNVFVECMNSLTQ